MSVTALVIGFVAGVVVAVLVPKVFNAAKAVVAFIRKETGV